MSDIDLLWHVEEACGNAHPSSRELVLGGFLLRAAGGATRRANSVNPLRSGPQDPRPILAAAEAVYAGLGQDALFRVPSIAGPMEARLAEAGYLPEGETATLYGELQPDEAGTATDVELMPRPEGAWYAAWHTLNRDAGPERFTGYRRSVDAVILPCAFACRMIEGEPVAIAYGAIDRGIMVLETVLTHPAHRRQGHARAVVSALRGWAFRRGAFGAALQVAADNTPAIALYRGQGYGRELYRYHYRRKVLAAA